MDPVHDEHLVREAIARGLDTFDFVDIIENDKFLQNLRTLGSVVLSSVTYGSNRDQCHSKGVPLAATQRGHIRGSGIAQRRAHALIFGFGQQSQIGIWLRGLPHCVSERSCEHRTVWCSHGELKRILRALAVGRKTEGVPQP